MRIALLNQSYPPMISGSAVVMKYLADQLTKRGHAVLVITASDQGNPYTSTEEGVTVVRVRSLPNPMRAGQRCVLAPPPRVYDELEKFSPDIIHLHDPLIVGLPAYYYGWQYDVPIVLTIHALPFAASAHLPDIPGLKNTAQSALWLAGKGVTKGCAEVIAPTRTAADLVDEKFGCQSRVISNGVDHDLFRPEPANPGEAETLYHKYGLDPALPIILHVGRLDGDKQVELVVEAATRVMRDVDAQLLIVGDGTEREKLIALTKKYGIQNKSHLPGYITTQGDLPAIYRLASVFCMGSEIEAQGIVLLEAAASGVPIVAFRATCFHEIVEDGINGYLVPKRDVNAMAGRIKFLLQNPGLAKKMGLESRRMTAGYSIEAAVSQHEELFQSLLPVDSESEVYEYSKSVDKVSRNR